jgi:hypothetical protein
MRTTPTSTRRRRAAGTLAGVAALAVAGGALALPGGDRGDQAGADPTVTSTSTTAAPTTTTTADPASAFVAWHDGLDPAAQLAFRLFTGDEADREAFARWITPEPEPQPAPVAAPAPAPAPTPAPTVNAPATGTGGNAYLDCVRQRESRGQYGVVNASSGAGGAYQFLQSTWDNTAANAGRPDLVGVHPSQAAPADQDAMAQHLYQWQGASPWAGGGC